MLTTAIRAFQANVVVVLDNPSLASQLSEETHNTPFEIITLSEPPNVCFPPFTNSLALLLFPLSFSLLNSLLSCKLLVTFS